MLDRFSPFLLQQVEHVAHQFLFLVRLAKVSLHADLECTLAMFLAGHTPDHWRDQLDSYDFKVRLVEEGDELAGFIKLGPLRLPVEPRGKAVELRQLYVLKPWHGSGAARELMDWVMAEARRRGADEIYLSVFTENHRARRFYARYGFEEVGPVKFMVGNHADDDIIMRLAL